jgi:uncharacterized protein (DUF736 family)
MATIGKFLKTEYGYSGTLRTLMLEADIELSQVPKEQERAPDFRIHGPAGAFGAAWKRVSAADREYLSCKLDDPTFPAPVYAQLVLADDGESYVLIWSR